MSVRKLHLTLALGLLALAVPACDQYLGDLAEGERAVDEPAMSEGALAVPTGDGDGDLHNCSYRPHTEWGCEDCGGEWRPWYDCGGEGGFCQIGGYRCYGW